jgi:predicted hydrolase (HD superfamily)
MNTCGVSVLSDDENIPEHILQSVVQKAKKTYSDKQSRLEFCAMIFGKKKISNPNCFYYHYFERKDK